MKALGITGFVIALLMFLGAMYLQFMLAPVVEAMETTYVDMGGEYNYAYDDALTGVVNLGEILIIGGGLSFILSVIPFIKTKNKLALIGAILSLAAVVVGLIHGTHMFS